MIVKVKSKLKKALSSRKTLIRVVVCSALVTLVLNVAIPSRMIHPTSTQEYAKTSVKILNLGENGGGSGVILRSSKDGSEILTNRHVCEMAENGGWVVSRQGKHSVVAIKKSTQHDLCLVKIKEDLYVETEVADKSPEFGDVAVVSGHPRLYPHTISHGTFSDRMEIQIVVDFRDCTKKEAKNNPIQCFFIGWPVVQNYDSQHISALILPGNSGSAVFNSDGKIAGLVFASGSRELHFGIIVPHQYVKFFVDVEAPVKEYQPVVVSK